MLKFAISGKNGFRNINVRIHMHKIYNGTLHLLYGMQCASIIKFESIFRIKELMLS